jgi:hypothetical protein
MVLRLPAIAYRTDSFTYYALSEDARDGIAMAWRIGSMHAAIGHVASAAMVHPLADVSQEERQNRI